LRDAHGWLKDHNLRVVAFDQLGTGASARPTDISLWEIGRYVEEVETVRQALGLGRVGIPGAAGWVSSTPFTIPTR
jgi:proline iminopeptidase